MWKQGQGTKSVCNHTQLYNLREHKTFHEDYFDHCEGNFIIACIQLNDRLKTISTANS